MFMKLIAFILIYPFLWVVSLLPFSLLYKLSDVVYFFVYYIIRYRKTSVREHLESTLPHYSKNELLVIEKKFYAHLCDLFIEMIKTMSISEKEIAKRFHFTNLELIKDLELQKKSIALMCSHYASYEWIISLNNFVDFKGYAIYKKINNPYFDELVRKIRLRFKATLITTKETIPTIEENSSKNILGIYGFASDQSPQIHAARHWKDFLGINVPVYTGAEMLAKRFDMNVVFLKTKKIKRGYYQATFEILAENVKEMPDYQITDKFLKLVEEQILEAPEFYFWTHKRWKHAGKNPNLQTTV